MDNRPAESTILDLEIKLVLTTQRVDRLEAEIARLAGSKGTRHRTLANRARFALSLVSAAITPDGEAARNHIRLWLKWRLGLPIKAYEPTLDRAAVPDDYHFWLYRFERFDEDDRRLIREHLSTSTLPKLTIIVLDQPRPAQEVASLPEGVTLLLGDLVMQEYSNWNAIVLSEEPKIERDPRIRYIRPPDSLFRLLSSTGESADHVYVLMAAGIRLRPFALYAFAERFASNADALLVYADEDLIDRTKVRSAPFFKPDFSPELFQRYPYTGECVAVRASVISMAMLQFDDAPLTSLFAILPRLIPWYRISHIPMILFHSHRRCLPMTEVAQHPIWPPEVIEASVSVIIPTKDQLGLLTACIESIERANHSRPRTLDIIVIDNGSTDADTVSFLKEAVARRRFRLVSDPSPFNYAYLNNLAAASSCADVLVFVNNDTEVIDYEWIEKLLVHAMKPDVGVVGAKLLYPNGSIQHGGSLVGLGGVCGHLYVGEASDTTGYMHLAQMNREVSAVTGACLAIRREVFSNLGGFDERLKVAFNDTLLCLMALERGYRNVFVADPLLVHHESKSRGYDDTPQKFARTISEGAIARRLFPGPFRNDRYYNPNLSLLQPYTLADPPRLVPPWYIQRIRRTGLLKILFLSVTHQRGHGVATVVKMQAEYLASQGHAVIVAGPASNSDHVYEGCHRLALTTPGEVAEFAYNHRVNCLVIHTMPFMSMARTAGVWPKIIIYDHGEPNPDWFSDAKERRHADLERELCRAAADRVVTNSEAIRAATGLDTAITIRLGNTHMPTWTDADSQLRPNLRAQLGWGNKIVVLNVCRFEAEERKYKGIDTFVEVMKEIDRDPRWAGHFKFVLCGKATQGDVILMEEQGLEVHANVVDADMADLYRAADIYMSLSRWEGYNLGIAQALAFGLPVIASDIPAHREFSVTVAADVQHIISELVRLARAPEPRIRAGLPLQWADHQSSIERIVLEVCGVSNDGKRDG
jgi:GT2 family glycosyltransferase/glycosyltransferase involved in cell wall biosynthesis